MTQVRVQSMQFHQCMHGGRRKKDSTWFDAVLILKNVSAPGTGVGHREQTAQRDRPVAPTLRPAHMVDKASVLKEPAISGFTIVLGEGALPNKGVDKFVIS